MFSYHWVKLASWFLKQVQVKDWDSINFKSSNILSATDAGSYYYNIKYEN